MFVVALCIFHLFPQDRNEMSNQMRFFCGLCLHMDFDIFIRFESVIASFCSILTLITSTPICNKSKRKNNSIATHVHVQRRTRMWANGCQHLDSSSGASLRRIAMRIAWACRIVQAPARIRLLQKPRARMRSLRFVTARCSWAASCGMQGF